MPPKDAVGNANIEDADQTTPQGAVGSGSASFGHTYFGTLLRWLIYIC